MDPLLALISELYAGTQSLRAALDQANAIVAEQAERIAELDAKVAAPEA